MLLALLAGTLVGAAVALLLQAAIARTAIPLAPERAFWQFLLLCFAGGLSGFALSAVSDLQDSSPDPAYRRARRPQRPSSRRHPPNRR